MVRVKAREIFVNCPRYVHKMKVVERSRFVPKSGVATPVSSWKTSKWAARNQIKKVGHGIYRFSQLPANPLDAFMLATLWANGRGVLSHDTALDLHGLCDINP
ncbi:MAG: hypothetical protein ACYC06_01365 [Ilumatobacteraceae bacterium]